MNYIAPLYFKFVYIDDKDSERKLAMFYDKIFSIAKKNILTRTQRKEVIKNGITY